jgi:hypothetical protein
MSVAPDKEVAKYPGGEKGALDVPRTKGEAMQSLVALAPTGSKCIKNKQTFFFIYIFDFSVFKNVFLLV